MQYGYSILLTVELAYNLAIEYLFDGHQNDAAEILSKAKNPAENIK